MAVSRHAGLVVLAIVTAAVPGVAHAQDSDPAPADPLHLDVVVVDRAGRPIAGLQPADLELLDGGAVQTIDAVAFVSPATAAGAEPPGRIFGILLDEFHIDPAVTTRVRDALARFLDSEIRANDRVVLVKPLDSLTRLEPAADLAEIGERIRTFEGRKGDYEPRSPLEETTMSRAPAAAEPERARVVLSALAALTRRLGSLGEGRKALLFISEGFTEVPPQGRLRGASLPPIVQSADEGDVAIYTIDPAPPAAATPAPDTGDAGGRDRTLLLTLAQQSGGASVSGDRLEDGLVAAARELDGYYRVTYRPTHALDGRHELGVRVNRPDAEVRVRAAHWAVPAPAAARPSERSAALAAATALPRLRPQQISRLINTWFGTARGADGRTKVTFTWEPRPRVEPSPAWLTLTAFGGNGELLFNRRVDPVLAIGLSGLPELSAVFDAPPGVVRMDMTIHDAAGETIDVDSRNIRLPDLHDAGTVLSTPAIIRAHNALQFRTLSADPYAPPAVSRRFNRTERLLVRVYAYAAGDRQPEVTARLVGRRGEPLHDLTALPDAPLDDLLQFDLPLASLSAGEYGIEIRAGAARELILFDVTN